MICAWNKASTQFFKITPFKSSKTKAWKWYLLETASPSWKSSLQQTDWLGEEWRSRQDFPRSMGFHLMVVVFLQNPWLQWAAFAIGSARRTPCPASQGLPNSTLALLMTPSQSRRKNSHSGWPLWRSGAFDIHWSWSKDSRHTGWQVSVQHRQKISCRCHHQMPYGKELLITQRD